MTDNNTLLLEHVADIVTSYVGSNQVEASQLPTLIGEIYSSLSRLASGEVVKEQQPPAVDPKKSVKPDHIVCLEDGKRFKSLKRHIGVHGMTPAEYRAKWGLPHDYPMVAPNYSEARSQLALASGLGRKREPVKKARRKA